MSVADALARGTIYRLCGAALAYPDPARLDEVARLARVAQDGAAPALRDQLIELASAAAAADAAGVAAEYVALFDGAVKCPPYEGAYGPPQMAGKAAQLADIAGFYAAFGLEAGGQPDVEDHIATELEFLSALAVKQAWATAEQHEEHAEITRDASASFLKDHLGRWAPAFASTLESTTDLPYYRAVARLLAMWVGIEVAHLGVTAEPLSATTPDPEASEPFDCPHGELRAASSQSLRVGRGA